jgi:hypothetical protein
MEGASYLRKFSRKPRVGAAAVEEDESRARPLDRGYTALQ